MPHHDSQICRFIVFNKQQWEAYSQAPQLGAEQRLLCSDKKQSAETVVSAGDTGNKSWMHLENSDILNREKGPRAE